MTFNRAMHWGLGQTWFLGHKVVPLFLGDCGNFPVEVVLIQVCGDIKNSVERFIGQSLFKDLLSLHQNHDDRAPL